MSALCQVIDEFSKLYAQKFHSWGRATQPTATGGFGGTTESRSASADYQRVSALVGDCSKRLAVLLIRGGHKDAANKVLSLVHGSRSPYDAGGEWSRLRAELEVIALVAGASVEPGPVAETLPEPAKSPGTHLDGPEGGQWVWWKGKRYDVSKGVVYGLLEHMWNRDFAKYEDLMGGPGKKVWDSVVEPQTVRSKLSEANKRLTKIGVPWKLSADSRERVVTKSND